MNKAPITDARGIKIGTKQLQTGHFLSVQWEARKKAIAKRVQNVINKIKKSKAKKKK
jgi:hypothetical protein